MKCFGYGSDTCDKPGTIPDVETPPVFRNPDDPHGPTVTPVHCDAHHRRLMGNRAENEASWRRATGGR
jgi:hypothetical protein